MSMMVVVQLKEKDKNKKPKEIREPLVDTLYVKDGVLHLKTSLETIAVPLQNIEYYRYF